MLEENENNRPANTEPESVQKSNQGVNPAGNRKELQDVPESGWEAGQGISNSQFIRQYDDDQNGTERGPSDAGIGMAEIRKKQNQEEEGKREK